MQEKQFCIKIIIKDTFSKTNYLKLIGMIDKNCEGSKISSKN